MSLEHKRRNGGERRHAGLAPSPVADRGSGQDQIRPLDSSAARDLPRATLDVKPPDAMRRRAERRQSSALIALLGDVERRTGEERRGSSDVNDIAEGES